MRKEESRVFNSILDQVKVIRKSDFPLDDKLENICKLLYDAVSYYDWVGFYLVDKSVS